MLSAVLSHLLGGIKGSISLPLDLIAAKKPSGTFARAKHIRSGRMGTRRGLLNNINRGAPHENASDYRDLS